MRAWVWVVVVTVGCGGAVPGGTDSGVADSGELDGGTWDAGVDAGFDAGRAPVDDGGLLFSTTVARNLTEPFGLVLEGGELYATVRWTKDQPSGDVVRVPRDGGALQTLVACTGLCSQLTAHRGALVWADTSLRALVRRSADGQVVEPLAANVEGNWPFARVGGEVLAVREAKAELFAVDVETSAERVLVVDQAAGPFAADSSDVFWANGPQLWRTPFAGGSASPFVTGLKAIRAVALTPTHVFWVDDGGTMFEAPRQGPVGPRPVGQWRLVSAFVGLGDFVYFWGLETAKGPLYRRRGGSDWLRPLLPEQLLPGALAMDSERLCFALAGMPPPLKGNSIACAPAP